MLVLPLEDGIPLSPVKSFRLILDRKEWRKEILSVGRRK